MDGVFTGPDGVGAAPGTDALGAGAFCPGAAPIGRDAPTPREAVGCKEVALYAGAAGTAVDTEPIPRCPPTCSTIRHYMKMFKSEPVCVSSTFQKLTCFDRFIKCPAVQ